MAKEKQTISKNNKLGTANISKLLIEFSIPAVAGMVLSSFYNLIDTAFLGQAFPDGSGVAVTTLALPIMLLLIAFTMLPGQGGNALAAILLGEGQHKKVEQCLGNSFILLLIFSIIIALIGYFGIDIILLLIGTTDTLWEGTKTFVQIQCFGFIFLSIGIGMNNFIRTAGAPKIALLTNVISVIVCVALNWLFVLEWNMGVGGSALATILGQGAGAALVIGYFIFSKKTAFKLKISGFIPNGKLMGRILLMGLASFAMNLASTIICIVFNWVVGYYGAQSVLGAQGALASIGVAQKVVTFAFMPLIGVAMGAQPIIGYNYGAENWTRVIRALRLSVTTGVAIGTFFLVVCYLFPHQIVQLFGIVGDLEEFSETTLMVYITFFPLVGFHAVGGTYFQSSGQPIKSAILELTRQVIFLIPMYLTVPGLLLSLGVIQDGLIAVILCPPTADFLSSLLTIIFIIIEGKKLRAKIKEQKEEWIETNLPTLNAQKY